MLESLGIEPAEEALYEVLLARSEATAAELAALRPDLSLPELLTALVDKRLARVTEGRFTAVPPDLALQGAVDAKQLALAQARARVRELDRVHRATPGQQHSTPVEVVPGDEAVERIIALHASAQRQVRAFETPPYSKVLQPTDVTPTADSMTRGVAHRILYGRAAVETQGLATLRAGLAAGEDARVVGEVPLRLALFDDLTAVLPARTGRPHTEGILLVRQSSLLDALSELFDLLWSSALPLALDEPEEADGSDDRTLVALLAAGMGDQAISRQLGISLRTIGRRVQRIQDGLNAATRFQAGVAVGMARAASLAAESVSDRVQQPQERREAPNP